MNESDSLNYTMIPPSVDEYTRLRESVGFAARSPEAAGKGLAGGLFTVTVRDGEAAVGMARVVGDGGCSFLVVDVIVLPEYQRRGIGRRMMEMLDSWMVSNIPPGGMVSLLGDAPGRRLYEEFGFNYTYPESVGMKRRIG